MDIHFLIDRIRTAEPGANGPTTLWRRLGGGSLYALAALALAAVISCTDRYNPFADYTNADVAVVYRSLSDGDTVSVFGTETLSVIVTVKELVERFRVSAPHNRLWAGADTVVPRAAFDAEPFTFLLSYYDTGSQEIVIEVSKSDGTTSRDTLSVFAVLPLKQDSVVAHAGDSITLRTAPVVDRDVVYYWSFGEGTRFISQTCSTRIGMSVPLLSGTGALWVSDGVFSSPADSFSFTVYDTVPPEVMCVNDGFVGADTVYTGDSWITFKVRIADRGDEGVDSASINGAPFDKRDNTVYYKLFDKLEKHGSANPLRVEVFALDNFRFRNQITKTFWIVYSDTFPRTKTARIVVLSPEADTVVTAAPSMNVFGTVENYSLDSLNLTMLAYVNDSAQGVPRTVREGRTNWEWDLALGLGENRVRIAAFDIATGGSVDWTEFLVRRRLDVVDTVAPRIILVAANGKPAHGLYTSAPTVVVEVRAVDYETGVDSLTINGKTINPSPASNISYFDTLLLNHVPTGNEIVVRAVDGVGNAVQQTVVVYRNRLPLIEQSPGPSFVSADSFYADTIRAGDPDGDVVVFDKSGGPEGLQVSEEGVITWMPVSADTGMHTITVRIWDGYQPVYARYSLFVYPSGKAPPGPVRFSTKSEDFPSFLEADTDTLRMTLRVVDGTGVAPFRYSARLLGRDSDLMTRSTDSVLLWAPTVSDTGYRQMIVVVEDGFPSRDTIYPRILVVPPNRPGVIYLRHDADTLADGTLNLNAGRERDTLVFVFQDEDSRLTERYSFVVRQARSSVVASFDSAQVDSYAVVVDPSVFDGYDTLIAILSDRGGYKDTMTVALYYGVPPDTPVVSMPGDSVVPVDSEVVFSWSGGDVDGDSLWYEVFVDTIPISGYGAAAAITSDTTVALAGLEAGRLYYYRIDAHDWKRAVPGPINTVYIKP